MVPSRKMGRGAPVVPVVMDGSDADRTDASGFLAGLDRALETGRPAGDVEGALHALTVLAHATLGNRAAALRPGALLEGERDYRVAGCFMITPDWQYNMLIGNVGFPPEQRRLMIPIAWNHPGWVVANEQPLLLENTDDHGTFRQFLKSSRMGSSIYAPMITPEGMVGQIVTAAQARWTYTREDLDKLIVLSRIAAQIWRARFGANWLAADYPALDAWWADRQGET